MAEPLTLDEIKDEVRRPDLARARAHEWVFRLLQEIGRRDTDPTEHHDVRDVAIRVLEHEQLLSDSQRTLLDQLLRTLGLYPYLDPSRLRVRDLIAYEAHRPLDLPDEDVVFHRVQASAYRSLLDGDNVVLSAPTSFGKSLIIDALVASGCYRNIVVVVPTIALIDEARRRLSRFRDSYRIITHVSQSPAERNIFVFTQERVIEYEFGEVDLFVIDEFYKLDEPGFNERAQLLNHAFYKLYKTDAQFYFLGPNINALSEGLPQDFRGQVRFLVTDFSTVALDVEQLGPGADPQGRLVELVKSLDEPTLIYCQSPASARRVTEALVNANASHPSDRLAAAVNWIGTNYHPDWLLAKAVAAGIGIHHGGIPRALAHAMVRSFNDGRIKVLVCTSTLIEGVNTSAKNVIVYDNKIALKKFDYFTFCNIRGRSGRMFKHYVGRVILFHQPPDEELPAVDIPILSQPADTPTSLLMQVEDEDLTERSRERLDEIDRERSLSWATLRQNAGVPIEGQLSLARALLEMPESQAALLNWSGVMPTAGQLTMACNLIWQYFLGGQTQRKHGVSSPAQLKFRIDQLRLDPSPKALIDAERNNEWRQIQGQTVDDVIDDVLDFLRHWASFLFPRYLIALSNIQSEILPRRGLPEGDFVAFATQVENLFLPAPIAALEEYGLPLQVAKKLAGRLPVEGGLDAVLASLRDLDLERALSSPFEQEIAFDVQRGI